MLDNSTNMPDILKLLSRFRKRSRLRQVTLLIIVAVFLFSISLSRAPLNFARKNIIPYSNKEGLKFRDDECFNCNPHNFELLIDNKDICRTNSNSPEIHLLILIASTHKGKPQRDAYRKTWLTYTKNNTGNIRYAFIFGNINNTEANKKLLEESRVHRDILQENFQDSYINLTLKTMMAYKWASTHCRHAKYLMKTDDDMYINIPGVLTAIKTNAEQLKTSIGGNCLQKADPVRDPTSKWFVSYMYYPKQYYPGYCSGTGYVTSMGMVEQVFKISPHVPFMYLEDVFVALCIEKIGKNLHNIDGFNSGTVFPIDSRKYKMLNMSTSHRVAPNLLEKLWNDECHGEMWIPLNAASIETPWTDC